jgi:hypothetical protein
MVHKNVHRTLSTVWGRDYVCLLSASQAFQFYSRCIFHAAFYAPGHILTSKFTSVNTLSCIIHYVQCICVFKCHEISMSI